MGGSSKKTTVGYWYKLGWHAVLCQDDIDAITRIKYADRIAWQGNVTSNQSVYIDKENLLGGEKREGGLKGWVDFMFGRETQQVNNYLAYHANRKIAPTFFGAHFLKGGDSAFAAILAALGQTANENLVANSAMPVPAFRGVVSLVFRSFTFAAMNPYMKDMSITVRRVPKSLNTEHANIIIDGAHNANPAHIIYDMLTNRNWGLGLDGNVDVNRDSFLAAAQTLYNEGFGLSLTWSEQSDAESFANMIAEHINAALYPSPDTDQYTLKLIRDDYDVETLEVFDESNISELRDFERAAMGDLVSEVVVEYHDRKQDKETKVAVQNLATIQSTGRIKQKVIKYPGIRNGDLAARVAMRELISASMPLCKCTIVTNQSAWNIRPGDVIKVSWRKLNIQQIVMRVVEVDYGSLSSGRITLSLVEDIFGLPATTYLNVTDPVWEPVTDDLEDIGAYRLLEIPYYMLIQSFGEDYSEYLADGRTFAGAIAARNNDLWTSFDLYEDVAGTYTLREPGTFSPWVIPTSASSISRTQTVIPYESFYNIEDVEIGDLGLWDDEFVQVTNINETTGQITILRGVLDTVPATHVDGSRIWLFGDALAEDYNNQRLSSETITYKLVPSSGAGQLDIASATAHNITMVGRQERPYPPGNVTINSNHWPTTSGGTLNIAWAHRDRTVQTVSPVSWFSGSIGPEPGVTYNLRFYNEDSMLIREVNQAGNTYTFNYQITKLLMHFDGTEGSTTFTDETGRTVTPAGNAQISADAGAIGGFSGLFDGTGDFLTVPASTDFVPSDAGFTIEMFVTRAASKQQTLVTNRPAGTAAGWQLIIWPDDTVAMGIWNTVVNTWMVVTSSVVLPLDTRTHVEVSYDGTTLRIFFNGTMVGSSTSKSGTMSTAANTLYIGRDPSNTARDFNGRMDELRISGRPGHTANFTPPTAPLSVETAMSGAVRIEIESVRDGLTSIQKFVHTVNPT